MRVIGGVWRGRPIHAPSGHAVRPTASRLREALFSAILPFVEGAHVVDLFAGSGALGIEALSRGAATAEFVELDAAALRAVALNLQSLGADPARYRIRRGDAWRYLARLEQQLAGRCIVLADPPYAPDLVARCLPAAVRAVESGRLLVFGLEHPANAPPPEPGLTASVQIRRRRHGHGAFTLLIGSDA